MQFLSNQIPFAFSVKTSGRSRPSDKGGGGEEDGVVNQTLTKRGAREQKKFFQPFGPQFGLKKKGGPAPPPSPGPSPGSTTENTIKRMRPIYNILIQPSLINKGKKLFLARQMRKILSKQDGPILPARVAKGSQML